MSSIKKLNIDTWVRKDHFNFYKDFDKPFYGLTANVDVKIAREFCDATKNSFFIWYLHKCFTAVNEIESLKYRIDDEGEVSIHEKIGASATINRPNGTFGFSYIDYDSDFDVFQANTQQEIDRVQNSEGLVPSNGNIGTIHFSAIPWVHFTSLSHAMHSGFKDSIPKISVGKIQERDNQLLMPVSIHVHHALVDGSDIGTFYQRFQNHLNKTTN
ncbi:CatA-like O-acetyltransferase [Spongiivirga citrea]|uniref:Chloramphenicol acetyltransferase n=1 Tax=Spongiivirga citrea TaxID=1481457 RepID=A0A6M0CIA9_9FLAO|nr:CatA-like O-acetyltransferase [Spongiivirga citrea]NER17635.1 chloramphenicol acetyltransferase [Spongiivirga citrea]